MSSNIALLIAGVVVVLLIVWVVATYNTFVRYRENVRNAMGQIATQIESRWDALTSVIAAAQQYAQHEAQTLREVTAQRVPVRPDSTPSTVERDDQVFASALARINALAENYPELRASETYSSAMNAVQKYEDNVRYSRMMYNDTVTKLNRYRSQFPSMIVGALFGFRHEEYFANQPGKSEMPTWS
ncbi:LemA family protein [Trueperella bialowiezensis]|nr:LemA family protein [Trueperella bialowiezensis]